MLYEVFRSSDAMRTGKVMPKPCAEAFHNVKSQPNWYVRLESLDELTEFIKKYGKVVVSSKTIEIYDFYRE